MPTTTASFRRWEPTVYLHKFSAIPFCFVLQHPHKTAPSHIADTTSQLAIFHHVFHGKGFDAYRLVFAEQARRKLMQEISSLVGDLGMDAGDFLSCFFSIL